MLTLSHPAGAPTPPIIDAGFHEVLVVLDAGAEDELNASSRPPRELGIADAERQIIV